MPTYCPTCKGLMRPQRGTLVCIRCTEKGRARTVMVKGKAVRLAQGQKGLGGSEGNGGASRGGSAIDPTLQPKEPKWRPAAGGDRHPQLGLFPFDTIRDAQKRFTRDVTLAVQGGRHLVAQAPTGLGKTAASLAPALEAAIDAHKTIFFLTSRQSQHRVAVDTVRMMCEKRGVRPVVVDLVSKRDMCLRHEASEMHPARFPDFCARETTSKNCQYLGEIDDVTLSRVRTGILHVEELMAVSKKAMLCPHMVALTAAKEAHIVVADYNHMFSDLRDSSLERLGVTLSELVVIVDEAHNLADRIRQSHAHRISAFLLDKVEAEAGGHKAQAVDADLEALRASIAQLRDEAEKAGRARPSRVGQDAQVALLQIEDLADVFDKQRNKGLLAAVSTHRTLSDVSSDLMKLATKVRKGTDAVVYAEELAEALDDWARFKTGGLRYVEWDGLGSITLHVRLLDAAVPARSVFNRLHSAILMSGTLRPPGMARDLLGLDPERTQVRTYPSPFNPQNRPIVIANGLSTRFAGRGQELWDRIGGMIADLCTSARGNVAAFFPSYAMLRDVQAAVQARGISKEFLVEDPSWTKADRDRVIDTLTGEKKRKGALLLGVLGASLAEGIDYKDNLLSAVVVVGLPLAPPDLEVEATIGYFERRHPGQGRMYGYTVPAMNKVLQAMGRGVRGPNDKCPVLLLDERYRGPPYRGLLPEDGIVSTSSDPVGAIRGFLQANDL